MKVMYEKRHAEEAAKKKTNVKILSHPPIALDFQSYRQQALLIRCQKNQQHSRQPRQRQPISHTGQRNIPLNPPRALFLHRKTHQESSCFQRDPHRSCQRVLLSFFIIFSVIQDKREIKQLLSIQKDEIDEVLKLRINQVPVNKIKKAEKKWGKHFPLYLALEYLEPKDLIKILQLNKEMRKTFKKRVYRHIFNNYGNTLTKKQRPQIWKNILDIVPSLSSL
jgi:hypothetical protein